MYKTKGIQGERVSSGQNWESAGSDLCREMKGEASAAEYFKSKKFKDKIEVHKLIVTANDENTCI